jgi:hypothetical protein
MRVGQFMLPIVDRVNRLGASYEVHPEATRNLPGGSYGGIAVMDSVRFMAQAQRAFARHDVAIPNGDDLGYWDQLLYYKWLDPVMGVVAAYELARRGKLESLPRVVDNLREYFPTLADTAVLQKFVEPSAEQPSNPPLLLDGMLTLGDTTYDGLRTAALDYRAMWTSWRKAVPRGAQE